MSVEDFEKFVRGGAQPVQPEVAPTAQAVEPESPEDFFAKNIAGRHTAQAPAPVAPPEPKEASFTDKVGLGFRGVFKEAPLQAAATIAGAIQGPEGVEPYDPDFLDRVQTSARESQAQFGQDVQAAGVRGFERELFGALPSLGYSAATLPVTAAAGALGTAVGGPVAGAVAGLAAGAVVMDRAAQSQILGELAAAEDDRIGRPQTKEEFLAFKKNLDAKVAEFGGWEAFPEAVGNVIDVALFKKLPGGGLVKNLAKRAVGFATTELGTEAITEIGQSQALEGTSREREGGPLSFTSPSDIATAAREVLPGVLVVGGGLTAASAAVDAVNNQIVPKEENVLASMILGEPGGVNAAVGNLGIDKKVLRERIQTLMASKVQNPDLDFTSPEVKAYLSAAVTATQPVEAAPETRIPVSKPAQVTDTFRQEAGELIDQPDAQPTDQALETAFDTQEEPLPRRRAVVEQKFGTREEARDFLDKQEGRIGVQIEEDEGGQFTARALFREGERPEAQAQEPTTPAPEQVTAKSGKPFTTERGALASKTGKELAATHQVVSVEGGFVFEKTERPATEVITPAEDTVVGVNSEGNTLYERADGARYRVRTDRKTPYPDFGGDLAPVAQEPTTEFSRRDPATQIALENVGLSGEQIAQVPDDFTLPTLWGNFDAKTQRAFTDRAIAEGKAISEKPVDEGRIAGTVGTIRASSRGAETQEVRDAAVFEEITGDETRGWADDLIELSEGFGADSPIINNYIQALVADPDTKTAIQGQMKTMGIPISNAGLKTYVARITAARGEVEFDRTDAAQASVQPEGTQTPKIQALTAAISRQSGTLVAEGTFSAVPPPSGQEAVYTQLSKVLGKDIVFFSSKGSPINFDGVTNVTPDTIYVNIDAATPHLAVTGHEFMHELKRSDSEIYAEFEETVKGMIPAKDLTTEIARQRKFRRQDGLPPLTAPEARLKAETELLADIFGSQMMTQEFWKKVEARNPDIFAQIVEKFIEFINNLKASFSGPQLADLNRAQNAAAKALAAYTRKNPPVTADSQSAATFKRLDESAKEGLKKLTETLKSAKNPSSKLADQRSRIFKVTPLPTLRDIYKDKVPQLVEFAKAVRGQVATRNGIVSEITVDMQQAIKIAKAGVGIKTLKSAMANTSLYQMTPWESQYVQEWVPEGLRQQWVDSASNPAQRRAVESAIDTAVQTAWEQSPVGKNTGKTYKEGYALAADAYKALKDPKLQNAFQNLADHTATLRLRTLNEVQRMIESTTKPGSENRAFLSQQAQLKYSEIKGAYFPLTRTGDYVVDSKDKDGFTWSGQYETQAAADEAALAIVSTGGTIISKGKREKTPKGKSHIPAEFLSQIQKAMTAEHMAGVDQTDEAAVADATAAAENALEQIGQVFLKWSPETASLKNSIRRQSILGFSENDMVKGYMNYAQTSAADIAYFRQGRELDGILAEVNQEIRNIRADERENPGNPNPDLRVIVDVRNDMAARMASIRNIQLTKPAALLGKAASYWLLSSPRQLFVQMSQIPILTGPKLASIYGMGNVTQSLTKSMNKAFSKKYSRQVVFDNESDDGVPVHAALEAIQAQVTPQNRDPENIEYDERTTGKNPDGSDKELGDMLYSKKELLDIVAGLSEYQKEMLVIRYAMSQGLVDISLTHEAGQFQQGVDEDGTQAKVAKALMVSLKLSELASRKTAILSTFDLATRGAGKAKGVDFFEAMEQVAFIVDDTLFDFSVEAKGTLFHQQYMRVLSLFQTFNVYSTIKLITLVKQSIKGESKEVKQQAAKELTMILGVTGALSGAMGLPFSQIIFALLDAFKDDDDFEDSEVAFKRELDDMAGGYASQVIRKGLPTMLGMDISKSVGFGKFLWTDINAPEYLHGDGLAAHVFSQLLGPAYAAPAGLVKGFDQMQDGEYARGLEDAVPKLLRDVMRAMRVAKAGVKTRGGKRLIEGDLRPDQIFAIAIGLPPADVLEITTKEFQKKQISSRISARIGELSKDMAEAIRDNEDTADELSAIQRFIKTNPEFSQNLGNSIKASYVKDMKGDLGMDSRREMLVDWKYFTKN